MVHTVPNQDVEIGGQSSRPLDKGGGHSPENFFLALQASVWSKQAQALLGPSPGSATGI